MAWLPFWLQGWEQYGSGSFGAQACSFSGTAVERFVGTGGLNAAAASFTGTGRLDEAGTGSFAAAAASFAGTGDIDESGSGAFVAGAAAFGGIGDTFVPVTGTGAFGAAAASFAGGVPNVDPNAGGGPGEFMRILPLKGPQKLQRIHDGAGAFAAQPAAFAGVGDVDQELADEEALLALV